MCRKCGETKQYELFGINRTIKKDGRHTYCKACELARVNAYKEANREKVLAQGRRSGQKHYEKNKADIRAKRRQYYLDNPDKWQEKLARNRAFTKANRAAKTADTIRYRARKAAAEGTATKEQIAARVAYYGFLCWMCRGPWREIDHVKPLTKGGTGWPANLRPICRSCNASKGNQWPFVMPKQQIA